MIKKNSSAPRYNEKSGHLLPLLLSRHADLKELKFLTILKFLKQHSKKKNKIPYSSVLQTTVLGETGLSLEEIVNELDGGAVNRNFMYCV